MTGTHPLAAAIDAARAQDFDGLRRLIDWPLAAAGRMARLLPGIFEEDRARLLAQGLADLDSAAERPEVVAGALRDLAPRFAAAREIRRADPTVAAALLAALRVPAPPSGLTAAQQAKLAGLDARVTAIREVFVLVTDSGDVPVAMAPDTGLLVLVLPD